MSYKRTEVALATVKQSMQNLKELYLYEKQERRESHKKEI